MALGSRISHRVSGSRRSAGGHSSSPPTLQPQKRQDPAGGSGAAGPGSWTRPLGRGCARRPGGLCLGAGRQRAGLSADDGRLGPTGNRQPFLPAPSPASALRPPGTETPRLPAAVAYSLRRDPNPVVEWRPRVLVGTVAASQGVGCLNARDIKPGQATLGRHEPRLTRVRPGCSGPRRFHRCSGVSLGTPCEGRLRFTLHNSRTRFLGFGELSRPRGHAVRILTWDPRRPRPFSPKAWTSRAPHSKGQAAGKRFFCVRTPVPSLPAARCRRSPPAPLVSFRRKTGKVWGGRAVLSSSRCSSGKRPARRLRPRGSRAPTPGKARAGGSPGPLAVALHPLCWP